MTPDPFARTPDATTEQKQGAVGCFMVAAWLIALPVLIFTWVYIHPAPAIGAAAGLVIVGVWASGKAGGSGGVEAVPDPEVPRADPEG